MNTTHDDGLSAYRCVTCGMETDDPAYSQGVTRCPACVEAAFLRSLEEVEAALKADGYDWLAVENEVPVSCLECAWTGRVMELSANACPKCDGRVREGAAA